MCNICKGNYITETKYQLLVHHYEHMGKSVLTYKLLRYNRKEGISLPLGNTVFIRIMWQTYVILNIMRKVKNNDHLILRECILILKLRRSLNIVKEFTPISISK